MAAALSPSVASARWPTGHFAWLFAGAAQFAGGATTFLAEGMARGERSMFVADDPRPDLWPRALLARGSLIVVSTSEVYGAGGLDPKRQRETFASVLDDALRDGYSGIRVAGESSSLVRNREQLAAWLAWEDLADDFMAEYPVTGMCGFDWTRVDAETISALVDLHPVSLVK